MRGATVLATVAFAVKGDQLSDRAALAPCLHEQRASGLDTTTFGKAVHTHTPRSALVQGAVARGRAAPKARTTVSARAHAPIVVREWEFVDANGRKWMVPDFKSWHEVTPYTSDGRAPNLAQFDVVRFEEEWEHSLWRILVKKMEGVQLDYITQYKWSKRYLDHWAITETAKEWRLVSAMKDGKTCAVGGYKTATENSQDTWMHLMTIPSGDPACIGGRDSLLCHMIQNSADSEGKFAPLIIVDSWNDTNISGWYDTFDCATLERYIRQCFNPRPEKCRHHPTSFYYADEYFPDTPGDRVKWNFDAETLRRERAAFGFLGLPPMLVALIAGCALGSGVMLLLLRVSVAQGEGEIAHCTA